MNVLIAGKYCLKLRIGNGSFGSIFMGTTNDTNQDIAIKLEKIGSKHTHLAQEWKALKELNNCKRAIGIPQLKWFGIEGDYQVLVMELLGPNLEEIFSLCKRKMPYDTVLKMTIQIIERIQYIHTKHYLHLDIKPENILIGLKDNSSILYLIDYGLSKKYINKNGLHITYDDNVPFVGTDVFSSISALRGNEQSRRDDLESALYVCLYFMLGSLPWQSYGQTHDYIKIAKIKEEFIKNRGFGIPSYIYDLLEYVMSIGFIDEPKYVYIINVLREQLLSMTSISHSLNAPTQINNVYTIPEKPVALLK